MSIDGRLEAVLRRVFQQPQLQFSRTLSAWDVPGWDSIGHMSLMLALEKEFSVRFDTVEIFELNNCGELVDLLEKKTSKRG